MAVDAAQADVLRVLVVQNFERRWFYPVTSTGQVDRTGPKKPNSPFADLGDAAAYLFGWLVGGS